MKTSTSDLERAVVALLGPALEARMPGAQPGSPPTILFSDPQLAGARAHATAYVFGHLPVAEALLAAVEASDASPLIKAPLVEQARALVEIARGRVDAEAARAAEAVRERAARAARELRELRCSDASDREWLDSFFSGTWLDPATIETVETMIPAAARVGATTWIRRQLGAIGGTVRPRDGVIIVPDNASDDDRRKAGALRELLNQMCGMGARRGPAAARAACRELSPAAIQADHADDVDAVAEWA